MLRSRSAVSRCAAHALAALVALVAAPLAARAETTALQVSTSPTLEVASEQEGQRIFSAASGSSVQLEVVAVQANGSNQTVTNSGTIYTSLAPEIVQVSATGLLSFSAAPEPWSYRAGAVVIEHGGVSVLQGFDVVP
jgi:hypothetical protein